MNIKIITLLTALLAASVAGVFSVYGMIALFAGNPLVGVAAGVTAELTKLVGVSFLYRYWKDKVWFRMPMLLFTLVAMAVTSLGVFGMLSKAHTDQGAPVANNEARIVVLDQKIVREQRKIASYNKTLDVMDQKIQVLIDFNKITVKDGANEVSATQELERNRINSLLDAAQTKIDTLQEQKFELSQVVRDFKVEVGPIAHIAKLVYGENDLEKAVTLVIVLIMFVLDPMAIMLLMGYNHIAMKEGNEKKDTPEEQEQSSTQSKGDRICDNTWQETSSVQDTRVLPSEGTDEQSEAQAEQETQVQTKTNSNSIKPKKQNWLFDSGKSNA